MAMLQKIDFFQSPLRAIKPAKCQLATLSHLEACQDTTPAASRIERIVSPGKDAPWHSNCTEMTITNA
jgi:hypothetical protein